MCHTHWHKGPIEHGTKMLPLSHTKMAHSDDAAPHHREVGSTRTERTDGLVPGAVQPPGSKGEAPEMESLSSPSADYRVADRRRKPRIYEPFTARVRGIDGRGDPFELEAV